MEMRFTRRGDLVVEAARPGGTTIPIKVHPSASKKPRSATARIGMPRAIELKSAGVPRDGSTSSSPRNRAGMPSAFVICTNSTSSPSSANMLSAWAIMSGA